MLILLSVFSPASWSWMFLPGRSALYWFQWEELKPHGYIPPPTIRLQFTHPCLIKKEGSAALGEMGVINIFECWFQWNVPTSPTDCLNRNAITFTCSSIPVKPVTDYTGITGVKFKRKRVSFNNTVMMITWDINDIKSSTYNFRSNQTHLLCLSVSPQVMCCAFLSATYDTWERLPSSTHRELMFVFVAITIPNKTD